VTIITSNLHFKVLVHASFKTTSNKKFSIGACVTRLNYDVRYYVTEDHF